MPFRNRQILGGGAQGYPIPGSDLPNIPNSVEDIPNLLLPEAEDKLGLDQGAIVKALAKLDAQIAQEEKIQKIAGLEVGSKNNVNPTIAAKHLSSAVGMDLNPDQLSKIRPITKRMSKLMADPNIPEDIKEASLQRDREDIEAITSRFNIASDVPEIKQETRSSLGHFIDPKTGGVRITVDGKPLFGGSLSDTSKDNELARVEQLTGLKANQPKQFLLSPGQQLVETVPGEIPRVLAERGLKPERERVLTPKQQLQQQALAVSPEKRTPEQRKALGTYIAPVAPLTPKQQLQQQALAVSPEKRTPEQKKALGIYVTPPKARTPLQLRKDTLTIKKMEKTLSSNIPNQKTLDAGLKSIAKMYLNWYGDDEQGYWNAVIKWIKDHPGIDASSVELLAQAEIGTGDRDRPSPSQQGTLDALKTGNQEALRPTGEVTPDQARQAITQARQQLPNGSPAEINALARTLVGR